MTALSSPPSVEDSALRRRRHREEVLRKNFAQVHRLEDEVLGDLVAAEASEDPGAIAEVVRKLRAQRAVLELVVAEFLGDPAAIDKARAFQDIEDGQNPRRVRRQTQ